MTEGLDAVSARLSITRSHDAVRALMHHSTRLHGFATFPVMIAVVVLAEPVLRVWVGARLDDPDTTLPLAVTLVRIMALGVAARAVSDGWIRILYGAGHVARYAPVILLGGILNPILAVLLLFVLPEPVRYTGVVWAFSAVLVGVHGGIVPRIGAKALGMTYRQMFAPLLRPLIISLICAPVLVVAMMRIPQWDLLRLGVIAGAYGVAYLGLCWIFVIDRSERERFTRAALKYLPGRA
jgi:peptidoglycan biosynthesis protein MviN/MurJ (putative lipid II flippase)